MASTGDTWRLGRRPALDGLRGVAVLMVVAYHTFGFMLLPDFCPGLGGTGVTVFFVLSGFLITSLLLVEWHDTRRIDLLAFAKRRVRRLIPALFVMLAVLLAAGLALPNFVGVGQALEAVLYVGNWRAAASADMGPLLHTWSLSVEEQFYLAFPLIAYASLKLWGRRGLLLTSAAACLASVVVRLVLLHNGATHDRIYYGTDTEASSLLLGAALACWVAAHGAPRVSSRAAGVLMLALLGAAFSASPLVIPLVVSVLTVGLVCACVTTEPRWLTGPRLVLIGRRSYALYLWHVPCLWLAGYFPVPHSYVTIPALACAWLLTVLSWRYVEQPFLRRRASSTFRQRVESRPAETVAAGRSA